MKHIGCVYILGIERMTLVHVFLVISLLLILLLWMSFLLLAIGVLWYPCYLNLLGHYYPDEAGSYHHRWH